MTSAAYVGRFAPSPTGSLHFGSLLAAMASYCDARRHDGTWRLRIDDIDPPRAILDAVTEFQQTLHTYGFVWDGAIIFQSTRSDTYRQHLQHLNAKHKLYLCACSRRDWGNKSTYPNTCRPSMSIPNSHANAVQEVEVKLTQPDNKYAIRVAMDENVAFTDLIQGDQIVEVSKQLGDAVLVRRDDLFAYALACAVDDGDGITRVVRGSDLLPTTATQIRIMELLDLPTPQYAHIPVALNSDNQKLSKQTQAKPLDTMATLPTLQRAWHALGQTEIHAYSVESFWDAAIPAWDLRNVTKNISTHYE